MSDKGKTGDGADLISRRQMLGYCLAGMAGVALWRSRYSNLIHDTKKADGTDRLTEAGSNNLTEQIKVELMEQGADLVGIGDLTELSSSSRKGLPIGICVAVKFPKKVISNIVALPTRDYYDWYNTVNSQLGSIAGYGVKILKDLGYKATASTGLPHKTIATRAGLGWVGKSALLVTEEYGSMIRLSSILTDAPLAAAQPVNESRCGDCMICVDACPAGALHGKSWDTSVSRKELLDTSSCSAMAVERSVRGFGIPIELCGKCFAVCRYTQQYIEGKEKQS